MCTLSSMGIRGQLRGLGRFLRFHWLLSVHRSRDPHKAGLAFGLGVFLGFLPMGALATVAAFFVTRKAGLPVPPAVAGTFTGNWVTTPFIYAASFWLGQVLTTGRMPRLGMVSVDGGFLEGLRSLLAHGPSFLLGMLMVSLLAGAVGYLVIRLAVAEVRKIRHALYARRIERMETPR